LGARAQPADAVELFNRAEAEFKAEEFAKAAEHLREAYALTPKPILLYNLGLACAALGDAPCALDAFKRYLPAAPPDQTAKVKLKIGEMDAMEKARGDQAAKAQEAAKIADEERAKAAEAARKADEERRRREAAEKNAKRPPPSAVPWVIAGVGVLGVGAGAA